MKVAEVEVSPTTCVASQLTGQSRALREALQLFWQVADGYVKRRLMLALGLVATASLLSALGPLALKLAIDSLGQNDKARWALAPAALVIVYALAQYVGRSCTELRTLVHGQAEQRMRRRIGQRLFDHLVRLPLRFHLDRKAGAMGETADQGIRGYELLLEHMTYTVLPAFIEFAIVAVVLIQLGHSPYLLILGFASVAYVMAFRRGAANIQQPASNIMLSRIESSSVLTDVLVNAETIKYFDAEPVVSRRYDQALGGTESAYRQYFYRQTVNGLWVAAIFALSLAASLLYATVDVLRGAMTIGDLVLVNSYVVRLVTPLEQIGFAVRDIAQGVAFLQKLLELLGEKQEGDASAGSAAPRPSGGALFFDNVCFSYRREVPILNNVSFAVPGGQTVAVVGVSGSGKSSLIRLLFRLYEPDSGRILLDGTPIAALSLSTIRKAIAVVPQDTVLFHDTIAHNIGFGRFGSSMEDIMAAARVANLHEFIVGLPEGYDTVVGERGLKLSGGERQRIAIARAALKQPRILVWDEATSSLDSRTEREILRNLLDISNRITTLVIAHRLSTVVHASEIIVLDRGIVIERGSHERLLAHGGHYASLWQAQLAKAYTETS